jgi:hypothetical protein
VFASDHEKDRSDASSLKLAVSHGFIPHPSRSSDVHKAEQMRTYMSDVEYAADISVAVQKCLRRLVFLLPSLPAGRRPIRALLHLKTPPRIKYISKLTLFVLLSPHN